MSNTKITIPSDMYLGTIYRENSVPLGFLTPDGTDSAALKRKSTVDTWISRNEVYESKNKVHKTTVKNELLSGFRLTKSTRRWATSNVVWRVVDPRGFEIEISSENLMTLIKDTTIINGEILGRLIYGRMGAGNILLHEHSEEYVDAQKLTEVVKGNISIKDVKPGYVVSLYNGLVAEYMGAFYSMHPDRSKNNSITFTFSRKKGHLFVKREEKKIYYYASPKIGKINSNKNEKTLSETLTELNNYINDSWIIESNSFYTLLGFASVNKGITLEYEEISEEKFFSYNAANMKKPRTLSNNTFVITNDNTTYMNNYYHPDHYDYNLYLDRKKQRGHRYGNWYKVFLDSTACKIDYEIINEQTISYFDSMNHMKTLNTVEWFEINTDIKSINWLKIKINDIVSLEYYYR